MDLKQKIHEKIKQKIRKIYTYIKNMLKISQKLLSDEFYCMQIIV